MYDLGTTVFFSSPSGDALLLLYKIIIGVSAIVSLSCLLSALLYVLKWYIRGQPDASTGTYLASNCNLLSDIYFFISQHVKFLSSPLNFLIKGGENCHFLDYNKFLITLFPRLLISASVLDKSFFFLPLKDEFFFSK